MITPSYSLTATERVLPKLALDFTTAALDPRVTFTRAGAVATVVNSSGYVEVVSANTPRFDFNPVTLVCRGLLIEEARTNLFLQSQFASGWSATRATLNPNVVGIDAPNNTETAAKLVEDTSVTTSHRMTQSVAYVSGTTYTISIFAKAAERSSFGFRFFNTVFGTSQTQYFDIANGTILNTVSGITASIENFGDGWYRCTATRAATATSTSGAITIDLSIGTTFEYTGDGTSGAYFWGAQLEAATFPTSYIPTEASQVTRTADVATMTGTNFSDWFNATEGAFEVESILLPGILSGFPAIYTASDGTANNLIFSSYNAGGPSAGFTVKTLGSNVANMFQTVPAFTATSVNKVCGAYKTNSFAASANGTAPSTDSAGALPTVNQLRFGSNLWVRDLNYWPQRLTNAEVQAFAK